MKKLLLILSGAFLFTSVFTSCKKSDNTLQGNDEPTLNSLNVANSFNWSTGSVFEFKVVGNTTATPQKAVLTVTESNSLPIYQCFHSSDQPLSVKLILQKSAQKLDVKYGGTLYEVNISGGVATFNVPATFALRSGSNNENLDGVMADSDGDGVEDDFDAYPADPLRAFNSFYPASGYGTLGYEDLWPSLGDFDFNDVVIDYQMQTVSNAANNVVEVIGHFSLAASGATFHDGFGFQIDGLAPEKISSVAGNHIDATPAPDHIDYAFNANGLETGQTYATCIVFDCFKMAMGSYKNVNTDIDSAYVPHVAVTTTVTFIHDGTPPSGGTVASAALTSDLFNFFIVSEKKTGAFVVILGIPNDTAWITVQDRGREIHLAQYHPTSLATPAYFYTHADSTINGNYYTTSHGLPWGINIIEGFEYPVEKCPIGKKVVGGPEAYHNFIPWALSGGAEHADWYKRNAVKAGNREDTLIYAKYLPAPGY